MRLNLGSGSCPPEPGVVNVDLVDLPEVDVVHDLDVVPWPWDDNSVAGITGQDIFEHVGNPIAFMTESWRVLETGGDLALKVPHYRYRDAFTDPTHKRFCTEHTWDYWIKGTTLYERHNAAYGGAEFRLEQRVVVNQSILILLRKL